MRTQQIIDALTNGVGEKPYCRRVDDVMTVFVADDQKYCMIAPIMGAAANDEDDEKQIAEAICGAGLALLRFQVAVNLSLVCEDVDSIKSILRPLTD